MSSEPHNVLVTGGAGFIGTNFVRHWMGRGRPGKVVVFDALTYAGRIQNLAGLDADPRFLFIRGDICDEAAVSEALEKHHIDTVVHFAAESHVDRSIFGPDEFVRTNVLGTHVLLKAAKALWIDGARTPHRFHHVSTDEVYGSLEPDDPAFHEATAYAPNSPYSASKAGSDHLVRAYHETYGLQTTITNCSNNYGPYQFPEKLIPLAIVNILLGKPIPVYGDGLQVRDWLHVEDHCRCVSLTLLHGEQGQVYNIGGNSETANIDLVRTLCGLVDELIGARSDLRDKFPDCPKVKGGCADTLISYVQDRPGHDRRYAIDFRKSMKSLGYTPHYPLKAGLRSTLEWYVENVDWWRALLAKQYSDWIDKNYAPKTLP